MERRVRSAGPRRPDRSADPGHPGRTFRYGTGPLSGRRAQVIVSTGSPAEHRDAVDLVRRRMIELESIAPIPDRAQNDGDHDDDLVPHDHLAHGERGIAAHLHAPEKETATS